MAAENEPALTLWQYMWVNKQTENFLLPDLNALGQAGWELVSVSYDRDIKGMWGWTAWLKRPLSAAAAGDAAAIAAGVQSAGPEKPALAGFDVPEGDFEFKDEGGSA
jgi:hypothetical protein